MKTVQHNQCSTEPFSQLDILAPCLRLRIGKENVPHGCSSATHVFILQVEQVVYGVVNSVREARHCHPVRLIRARLREADVHLQGQTEGR